MNEQTFSLGVTYWPRPRTAGVLCSWAAADLGALRDELGHIRELGCDTVRLELRWAEAQPGPSRIDSAALRGLERALDRAQDQGLRVVVAVLGGSLGGALHLPEWTVGYRLPSDSQRARRLGPPVLVVADDQPAVLAGDRYRREPPRDLFVEPELVEAQRYLLHEVVGNLGAHPAVAAWQLAADLERARRPASGRAVADWWSDMVAQTRREGARAVIGTLSPLGLGRRDSVRPERLHALEALLAVSAAPLPPLVPTQPSDPAHALFLHAVVAGLLRAEGQLAPVLVADLGVPTMVAGTSGAVASEAFGRPFAQPLADEDQQATFVETALAGLQAAGAAGVWLAAYSDTGPEQWNLPPADRSWWARSAGLVAPGGREKPVAAAVRTFAARLRAGTLPAPVSSPALPIDPERYWRSPATSLKQLWSDWRAPKTE